MPIKTKHKKYPPWFNKEIILLITKKYKLRIKLKDDPDNILLSTEFKILRNNLKFLITHAHDKFITNMQENIYENIKQFRSCSKSKRQSNTYLWGIKVGSRKWSLMHLGMFFTLVWCSAGIYSTTLAVQHMHQ